MRGAHDARGLHELLVAQREHLSAHDARHRQPRHEPQDDEERREAEDERQRGHDDPARRPGPAQLTRLDGRHGRQVAGYEREHAGGEEGQEPGDERDRQLLEAHCSSLASSSSIRRSRL